MPAWLLNQKLTLRLSMNLVTVQSRQSRTEHIGTGFARVIDMIEADWATPRHNLMVCCVNFEAPRLTSELCCCGTRFRMMTWNKPPVKAGNDRFDQKNYYYILWFSKAVFLQHSQKVPDILTTLQHIIIHKSYVWKRESIANSRCSLHLERTSTKDKPGIRNVGRDLRRPLVFKGILHGGPDIFIFGDAFWYLYTYNMIYIYVYTYTIYIYI